MNNNKQKYDIELDNKFYLCNFLGLVPFYSLNLFVSMPSQHFTTKTMEKGRHHCENK